MLNLFFTELLYSPIVHNITGVSITTLPRERGCEVL